MRDAKESLKPQRVRLEQALRAVPASQVNRRKNRAFRRQGEWFFIEESRLQVDAKLILRNEPIRRGGGKPHTIAEVIVVAVKSSTCILVIATGCVLRNMRRYWPIPPT